ncbi:MAG: hypothetical protein LBP83_03225 [Dysgonamonadaceae bacterium]|nr:hypothetical protein [Dysgonamonadaceae bacterium]
MKKIIEHNEKLFFKPLQVFRAVVNKQILIYNVVTGKEYADGRGSRSIAFRNVYPCSKTLCKP